MSQNNLQRFGFMPPSIHLVANVWRNTCMENLGICALSQILNRAVSYVLFLIGVPFLHKNTNSLHSIVLEIYIFPFQSNQFTSP